MKDITFDTHIVAANPYSDQTNTFVKNTMQKIRTQSLAGRLPVARKRGFSHWLRHLSRPALALLALLAVALVSGAVYAAVQFAPALIKIMGKDTNNRGATEYSVAGFADCNRPYQPATNKFEVSSYAPALSDGDIQKILQAKCELQWIDKFVSTTWPTYGTNPQWKDGDQIYYTRTDILGKVDSLNDKTVTLKTDYDPHTYQAFNNEKIKAYQGGAEMPLGNIKSGDTVFSIVRVTETYHEHNIPLLNKMNGIEYHGSENNPRVLGLVALFKLSLPDKYYGTMQSYLTEVPQCTGNDGESCPNTPSIDVYPRGGEGAAPIKQPDVSSGTYREISGAITELGNTTLTLKSSSGKLYTVSVDTNGFAIYNRDFTAPYTDVDAHLKVGSRVDIRYVQPTGADATKITKDQLLAIVLQLEMSSKQGPYKQY